MLPGDSELFAHFSPKAGDPIRWCCHDGPVPSYKQRYELKVQRILDRYPLFDNRSTYAESSHLFIKSFWDVATDAFASTFDCRMDVVVLRRELAKVVHSLVSHGWGATRGRWYYVPSREHCPGLSTFDITAAMSPTSSPIGARLGELFESSERLKIGHDKFTGYHAAIEAAAYTIDVEARAQAYIKQYGSNPNVFIHEVSDYGGGAWR